MHVLVALDGGPVDEAVCLAAGYLCKPHRDSAVLLSVISPDDVRETASASRRPAAAAQAMPDGTLFNSRLEPKVSLAEDRSQAMQRVIQEREVVLRSLGARYFNQIPVETHVLVARDTAHAIVEHAKTVGADGVAVGARRQSSLSEAVLGSVASAVIRTSPVPVLVLREGMLRP
jgi:nucleotide-binding universal stress UspA family protein